jgi:hypothetical protein
MTVKCLACFCDLSKVLDRIWHKGLIFKLQTYGITGDILQWFKSYLCSRSQRVLYKDLLSSKLIVFAGVPQGAVVGPLIFFLFM